VVRDAFAKTPAKTSGTAAEQGNSMRVSRAAKIRILPIRKKIFFDSFKEFSKREARLLVIFLP